ncbi:MAG: methyltransferase family protein [Acidimicrobiales bacterium]
MSRLLVKNIVFSLVIPGVGAVLLPWWLLSHDWRLPSPSVWPALAVVLVGLSLYVWCARAFAVRGRGTPGPWDPPRQLVVSGPYRWVRNPIYLAAITVVLGEAWIFESVSLLEYAAEMAVVVHVFVIGYEEPVLRRSFGDGYLEYKRRVSRWLPRRPSAP